MSTPEASPTVGPEAPRDIAVMVRLNEPEHAEVLDQIAEISKLEGRTVSKAEVIRRRAWGTLPIPFKAAA